MITHFLNFPNFDPVIFSIGPVALHWYGLMYLLGFLFAWWLATKRANKPNSGWSKEEVENLIYLCFIGVFIGGRVGYVIFYNFPLFLADPLYLFRVWQGGMSFHGGLLGVITMMFIFAWRNHRRFLQVSDFVAPLIPFGLGLGRLGNFINGELWGRVTNISWGMRFPTAINADQRYIVEHPMWAPLMEHGMLPRHPSQLYQLFFEGILLFILLNVYQRKPHRLGSITALFLIGYGSFRFITEYFREPDAQIGLLAGVISMGQLLSLPMIIIGLIMMLWPKKAASLHVKE